MKIFRKILLLVSAVALMVTLAACQTGGLEAIVVDATDGSEVKIDTLDFGKRSFQSETADKIESITFEGETYTGEYEISDRNGYFGGQLDIYKTGGRGRVELDAKTGEWAVVQFDEAPVIEDEKKAKPKEELEKIACAVADKYIDRSQYTLVEWSVGYYGFVKYLEGIRTQERFSVAVREDGVITQIYRFCMNKFPTDKSGFSKEEQARADLLLSQKSREMAIQKAKDAANVESAEIDEEQSGWVLLEDGTLGIEYVVSTEVHHTVDDQVLISACEVVVLVK